MGSQRGLVQRIERKLEATVGDAFARVFGGSIVPQEVEVLLRREAADGVRSLPGNRLLAPNEYIITLSVHDFEKLGADPELTSGAFARYLADYIQEQGWQTYGDVVVRFERSSNLHTGQFRARGTVNPDVEPRPTVTHSAPPQSDDAFGAEPGVRPMTDNPSYRGQGQGRPDEYYDDRYQQGGPPGYPPEAGGYPPQQGYPPPQHPQDQGGYGGQGYDQGPPQGGYDQRGGYQGGYDQGSAPGGYDQRGGYQGQGGYGAPGGYPEQRGYQDQSGGYGAPSGYGDQGGGYGDQGQSGYAPTYEAQPPVAPPAPPAGGYGGPGGGYGQDQGYQQGGGYGQPQGQPQGGQPGYGGYGDYGREPARQDDGGYGAPSAPPAPPEPQRPSYPDQGGGYGQDQGYQQGGYRQDYGSSGDYTQYAETAAPGGYAPQGGGYGEPAGRDYDYGQPPAPDYGQQAASDYGQVGGGYGGYGQGGYGSVGAQVTLQLDDGSGRTYQLRDGSNIIGRGQDAQFRLPDTGVSRRHLEIRWDGQVALLSDLNSTNGTTVNNAPVQEWQLADGDVIRLGHSEIIVRIH
ncbi:DUF3662 and FHA domain-containing protein [Mycobacterium asiaticum]|uniref:FHA domain-containing protein n=1 Tax=Mycobacterium asiaticum TaxID=1790 RepID=A0A1A3HVD0_MYCAS|nr:DUF3662 and FHA domain-containing protein [Mycobacterium asiaticum]OBI89925.1 hypothetical protein A5661_03320 [Mycobacterium asiaticum]OBJ51603.1 hypothetical protein A9W94_26060 [Mycobacterium asiaticum]OBJ85310.1 hypothetical protein A5640_13140 [Mycobacterium asiaticum]ORA12380.1 hypothetical protein BST16_17115 [Mycobacterium asiaticum DSM 44297]